MLCIGPYTTSSRWLMAPIAGYTDLAFRLALREASGSAVGLCHTDLINPRGLRRQTAGTLQLVRTTPDDHPLSIQLYGSDSDELAEAAKWCCEHRRPVTIDLNMGCPVDKVAKKTGAGAMLLCSPESTVALAAKVVRAVAEAAPNVPVTAKMRLGWDETNHVAHELAVRLADVGIAMVTVHGRVATQRFSGRVDRQGIAKVVAAMKRTHPAVPVIGNGDVKSPGDAIEMMNQTGCDGVMIGRQALRDLWIFRRVQHYCETGQVPSGPTPLVALEIISRQFFRLVDFTGERYAMNHFRQRVAWYSAALGPRSKPFREQVRTMTSVDDFARAHHTFAELLASCAEHEHETNSPVERFQYPLRMPRGTAALALGCADEVA